MKHLLLSFVFLGLVASFSHAATGETDPVAKAEIAKLSFMAGKWRGKAWIKYGDNKKAEIDQTENIQFKLDDSLLLVEGLGMSGGKVSHNALAIVSWDKDKGHYSFRSYLANGSRNDFKAELIDGKFYWYPNKNSRYIIYLNDKGQWYETGEFMRDGEWHQFFEMTLDKQ